MEELIVLGGSLAFVLVVVWLARRLYFGRPFSFYLGDAIYTRHGDGRFTTATGAVVADPNLLSRLTQEWEIVSHADSASRAGRAAWPGYPADRGRRSRFGTAVEAVSRFLGHFRL